MAVLYPTWRLAKFTTEAFVDSLSNVPQGFAPVTGLSHTDYAFSGGRYEFSEVDKRFYMDTRYNLNQYYFDLENYYSSGDYQTYGPRSLICTTDYISSDFSTAAVYFNVNMDERYTDINRPSPTSARNGDDWGGNPAFYPTSPTGSFTMRAYLFDPSLGFQNLGNFPGRDSLAVKAFGTWPVDEEPWEGYFSDTGILGTGQKSYAPSGTTDQDYGTAGFRLNISPKAGESIISNSSTGLGLQLVPAVDNYSPNIEIIGIQLGDVLLGVDQNNVSSDFWQDFHKTAEVEV